MIILAWFGFILLALRFVGSLINTIKGQKATERAANFVYAGLVAPAVLFFIIYLFVR
jgi:hypothetical protein